MMLPRSQRATRMHTGWRQAHILGLARSRVWVQPQERLGCALGEYGLWVLWGDRQLGVSSSQGTTAEAWASRVTSSCQLCACHNGLQTPGLAVQRDSALEIPTLNGLIPTTHLHLITTGRATIFTSADLTLSIFLR